jgi:hypothetical protein
MSIVEVLPGDFLIQIGSDSFFKLLELMVMIKLRNFICQGLGDCSDLPLVFLETCHKYMTADIAGSTCDHQQRLI